MATQTVLLQVVCLAPGACLVLGMEFPLSNAEGTPVLTTEWGNDIPVLEILPAHELFCYLHVQTKTWVDWACAQM